MRATFAPACPEHRNNGRGHPKPGNAPFALPGRRLRATTRRTRTRASPSRTRQWLLAGVCAVLLAAVAGPIIARIQRNPTYASNRVRTIAVLPLVNLSADPEQEYFADGMTEELITELAQLKTCDVISRTSVMRYKGSKQTLREIARANFQPKQ